MCDFINRIINELSNISVPRSPVPFLFYQTLNLPLTLSTLFGYPFPPLSLSFLYR